MKYHLRKLSIILALLAVAGHLLPIGHNVSRAHADGLSGSGTIEDPYQITDCVELQAMNADLDASYALTQDIDCSDTATWNDGAGFDPIGGSLDFLDVAFDGNFDGRGHSINDLYINRPDYPATGLFGSVVGSDIGNVSLNGTVIGSDFTGGLAGFAYVIANIHDVTVDVDVSAVVSGHFDEMLPLEGAGGVVGFTMGTTPDESDQHGITISRTHSSGSVSTEIGEDASFAVGGGIVGMMVDEVTLSDSYTDVDVTSVSEGQAIVGGAVGGMFEFGFAGPGSGPGSISSSYSLGTVTAEQYNMAGGFLAGAEGGIVSHNFTASPVAGPVLEDSDYGNFMGFQAEDTELTDNFLDVARTEAISCVGSVGGGDAPGCTGVNYGEGTGGPDYFFGNHTNPPLDAWDFDCIWRTQVDDYPILKTYNAECAETPDDSGGSDSGSSGTIHLPKKLSASSKLQQTFAEIFATPNSDVPTPIDLNDMEDYMLGSGYELTDLKVGQVIKFDITKDGQTEHHTITVKKIGYDNVVLTVASKPFDLTVHLDEVKPVVIEGQTVMNISLTSVNSGSATMFVSRVAETSVPTAFASEDPEVPAPIATSVVTKKSYPSYLAVIGLVLVLSAVVFALRRKRRHIS